MKKSPDAFRTISEVAEWLGTPTHVLRFWESRFIQVKPVKRAGGRRYYRPTDMELLGGIKQLLHADGMTIRGVQKLLREEGVKHVAALSMPIDTSATIEGTSSTVEDIAKIAGDVVIEAPIEIDVTPEPLENVVPITKTAKADEVEQLDAESSAFEQAQAASDPAPAAEESAPATFKPAEEDSASEPVAEPDSAPSLEIDVPDDPEDDDIEATEIFNVATAIRGQSRLNQQVEPAPEVLSHLYNRLIDLRDRMASRD